MRGFGLRRRVGIDPLLRFVGPGVIRAALFDLGPYPAAIRAAGQVWGELYGLLDADALLARVDAVEGYTPDDVPHSQYIQDCGAGQPRPGAGMGVGVLLPAVVGISGLDPVRRLPAARYSGGAARSDVNASTKLVIAAATWLETSTNSIPE